MQFKPTITANLAFLVGAQALSTTQLRVQDLHQGDLMLAYGTLDGSFEQCPYKLRVEYEHNTVDLQLPCDYNGLPMCRMSDTEKFMLECRIVEPDSVRVLENDTVPTLTGAVEADADTSRSLPQSPPDAVIPVDIQSVRRHELKLRPTCNCAAVCSNDGKAKKYTSVVLKESLG